MGGCVMRYFPPRSSRWTWSSPATRRSCTRRTGWSRWVITHIKYTYEVLSSRHGHLGLHRVHAYGQSAPASTAPGDIGYHFREPGCKKPVPSGRLAPKNSGRSVRVASMGVPVQCYVVLTRGVRSLIWRSYGAHMARWIGALESLLYNLR
jgi:hypothetical protein